MAISRPPAPELVAVGALVKGDRFTTEAGHTYTVAAVYKGVPEGETFIDIRRADGSVASVSVNSDTVVRRLVISDT